MCAVSMREAWESNAEKWIGWARRPGFDSYHQFHGRRFLGIVPAPGRLTIDLGAGEGRLARDLVALGHRVIALDASPSLARACAASPEAIPTLLADAAATPFRAGCADLVVAFMSLQDVDDWEGAIGEAARLLIPGGRFLIAIVHPINSAGTFEGERDDREAPFVIRDSYLVQYRVVEDIERDGMPMTFHSEHRPLESYIAASRTAGFSIDDIREVTVDDPNDRWARIPMFLHIAAVLTR